MLPRRVRLRHALPFPLVGLGVLAVMANGCACPAPASSPVGPPATPNGGTTAAPAAQTTQSDPPPRAPDGVPDGVLVTITGKDVGSSDAQDYWSANMAHNLFDVTSVNGKAVQRRVELEGVPEGTKPGDHVYEGYFYQAVKSSSLVVGFDPPDVQGVPFAYTTKFRVKVPRKKS